MQALTELKVGEALVSFLDEDGLPGIVSRAFVIPPASQLGTISIENRNDIIRNSMYYHKYETTIDRESAYELLQKKIASQQDVLNRGYKENPYPQNRQYDYGGKIPKKSKPDSVIAKMAKSAASSVGRQIGRELIRGIFGILLKR